MQETETNNFTPNTGSYRSILKSTSLIGGASFVSILIGMVKTKFVAILLGPTGVGLMGMYNQITNLVSTFSGMGLSSSGVRQVAEAVGADDEERIARTVKSLRRTVWLTGGIGMLVMLLACVPISLLTFGDSSYALPVALLSIVILLSAITSGQACILQGTRRIGDLAKISVIGAANGTLISIPCFYIWGVQGIVISLILCAIASLVTSWWFARRVEIKPIELHWHESFGEAKQMLSLGIGIMGAGLVTALSTYLIRVVLLRQFSLDEVGIYQAAFLLSGVLVGFVLKAMGTDYYPRLTAVAQDTEQVRRMVNEQTEISLLLALPLLVAMMIFAPLIIRIFYADTFATAVPVLRWCLLGVLGRVISWPLGFVMLAKGKGRLFFGTEFAAAIFHVVAVYGFIVFYGLNGAGIAFMGLYVFYTVLMLFVTQKLIGWTWKSHVLQFVISATILIVALMFISRLDVNIQFYWVFNTTVLLIVSGYSLRQLSLKSGLGLKDILGKLGI
ncbi:MAG: O-antigen translocase [Sedimentisphaerales bacterium]|nr:O-antigen translocase [Sedimentisphaerales bacterium]